MQACPNDRINTSYNCGQAWIALFDKRMKEFSVFDIIGPRMVGPSSSHTAGAVRIGLVAHRIARGKIRVQKSRFTARLHKRVADMARTGPLLQVFLVLNLMMHE